MGIGGGPYRVGTGEALSVPGRGIVGVEGLGGHSPPREVGLRGGDWPGALRAPGGGWGKGAQDFRNSLAVKSCWRQGGASHDIRQLGSLAGLVARGAHGQAAAEGDLQEMPRPLPPARKGLGQTTTPGAVSQLPAPRLQGTAPPL